MLNKTQILEFLNTLGANLRKKRNELKLSYDAIEIKTGISKSILSRIENGVTAPSFETFLKLHLFLGIDTNDLYSNRDLINRFNQNLFINKDKVIKFTRKNYLGRPAVSAEIEFINANTTYKLQARRSIEENIMVMEGVCVISFLLKNSINISKGEIYTIPFNKQYYELFSLDGASIIRITVPLTKDQSATNRYLTVLGRTSNGTEKNDK